MKKILILNCSPRNQQNKEIIIHRKDYDVTVPSLSSCHMIEKILTDNLRECYIDSVHLKNISGCTACYGCVNTGKCCKNDQMKDIYPKLKNCTDLVIISPLYYATILSQLLAFFNRLYPYWISSYNIDPVKGSPNNYPKLNVFTIATCADPWQKWGVFDNTLCSIYSEIGWVNKNIIHLPAFSNTQSEIKIIENVAKLVLD